MTIPKTHDYVIPMTMTNSRVDHQNPLPPLSPNKKQTFALPDTTGELISWHTHKKYPLKNNSEKSVKLNHGV